MRKRVAVLGTSFVKISEVDTDTPLPVFLLYYHRIRQQFWIPDLGNEACLEQSVDFFIHSFRPLRSELSSFLPNRFERRVDDQLVGRYDGVYPLHI